MQGLHITADCHACACDPALLIDAQRLGAECVARVASCGLQPVAQLFHTFPPSSLGPGGVTATVLLAESHLCLHTWPEQSAVTLDVYVCNFGGDHSAKAEMLLESLTSLLQPVQVQVSRMMRGKVDSELGP
jgi:S-adenosylmethionine decarboxylase